MKFIYNVNLFNGNNLLKTFFKLNKLQIYVYFILKSSNRNNSGSNLLSIDPGQNDKHNANISQLQFHGELLMDSHREFLIQLAIFIIIEISFKIFVG